MSSPSPPSEPIAAPLAGVPRLTCSRVDGKPYERFDDVEKEIARALSRPQAEWETMADERGCLSNEALVFLIRQTLDNSRDLCGRLLHKLAKRAARIAEHWAQGFDRITTEEIVLQVEMEIVELVLAQSPSRQSEFLEIAFGTAVYRRTINAVEKRKHSPLPVGVGDANDFDSEPENPADLVADDGPSPEEVVKQLEDVARRREFIRIASAAVKDRRHLEALILRYVHDWPITGKPDIPSLARHFGKSGRQIQNWISGALEAMRAAIGETK